METPICDFVNAYRDREALRLHMPGHKGADMLGMEALDITEIDGADVLYSAKGIIKRSEENAAELFGTTRTLYSTEGSSLAIRAMLYLTVLYAKEQGKKPVIAAGRNAHKTFLTAAALLDIDPVWIYPEEWEDILSCEITEETLEQFLAQYEGDLQNKRAAQNEMPVAVYITSPDYLGNVADVRALASVCHRHDVLLLVDNAHGAYLNFLPGDWADPAKTRERSIELAHPMALGADLCCDSGHKTLPVLTGGAYLHISKRAPKLFADLAEQALSLFASTSPSYLILQSLDRVNRYLAEGYRERLAVFAEKVRVMKDRLVTSGYELIGAEPLKLTIRAKACGYTGEELAGLLLKKNMVCEFSDPDYLVLMLTPELGEEALIKLETTLLQIERKPEITEQMPRMSIPEKRMTPREAMFSPGTETEIHRCKGKVLAAASVSCPPAIPIVVCGEVIDESAIRVFEYYGIGTCVVH